MSTVHEPAVVDGEKLQQFVFRAVDEIGATLNAALVVMGDTLGLYRALAGAGSVTSVELARRTGVSERYVREWCNAQAAGGYLGYDPVSGGYTLAARADRGAHRRDEPGVPAGVLSGRARHRDRLAADHRDGAQRRRDRMARAQPQRVRGDRAVLPAGLQRAPDLGVAARAGRRRREAGARGARRRHRLWPWLLDDPDGAGVTPTPPSSAPTTTRARSRPPELGRRQAGVSDRVRFETVAGCRSPRRGL